MSVCVVCVYEDTLKLLHSLSVYACMHVHMLVQCIQKHTQLCIHAHMYAHTHIHAYTQSKSRTFVGERLASLNHTFSNLIVSFRAQDFAPRPHFDNLLALQCSSVFVEQHLECEIHVHRCRLFVECVCVCVCVCVFTYVCMRVCALL